ncbi:hypothetical protein CEXT_390591 [Caerostris extrusa]|uniref:Uncharacterized protein n=1 Tax=Caerostris extrusa TaxID=172846 RepID=A0AAV4UY81_CAEEX|nr:hypothetical protein CEXT_390591 [Caerostris extrusa]
MADRTLELQPGACRPSDGRNQNGGRAPISIRDTQACFFILSMGWVAGFIVLFIERSTDRRRIHSEPGMVLHKRKRRKQKKGTWKKAYGSKNIDIDGIIYRLKRWIRPSTLASSQISRNVLALTPKSDILNLPAGKPFDFEEKFADTQVQHLEYC